MIIVKLILRVSQVNISTRLHDT